MESASTETKCDRSEWNIEHKGTRRVFQMWVGTVGRDIKIGTTNMWHLQVRSFDYRIWARGARLLRGIQCREICTQLINECANVHVLYVTTIRTVFIAIEFCAKWCRNCDALRWGKVRASHSQRGSTYPKFARVPVKEWSLFDGHALTGCRGATCNNERQ